MDARDPSLPESPTLRLRPERVNSILGVTLSGEQITGLLRPLGFELTADGDAFDVKVPTWRLEVHREIDLIEEVARMWGYQRIERTVPAGAGRSTGVLTARQRERRRIRQVLTGAGVNEAWTTTFLGPGDLERAGLDPAAVEVQNPLDRSESLLRTSLLPGLLKALRFNLDRQLDDLALFEIGRVFSPPPEGQIVPVEAEHLAVAVLPPAGATGVAAVESAVRSWQWLAAALRLDRTSIEAANVPGLHPARSARLLSDGVALGEVGEVDADVVSAYGLSGRIGWLRLSLDELAGAPRRSQQARDVSRYPASDVDLAFVAPDAVPAAALVGAVRAAGGDLLEDLSLFDVYRGPRLGEGRRSLALRVRLRAMDRTLSDAELGAVRQQMIDAAAGLGAELRA